MKQSEMYIVMQTVFAECQELRGAGQKEYAHDNEDVFANFNRVANLLEEDRKKVLMTYMLKHIDGIVAYVKGHKSQREDVTGRITDCMVYLMLLWGMIEEEKGYGTLFGTKNHSPLHDVLDSISDENIGISLEGGSVLPHRIQPNGDLQEVRKKGSRLKESKEVGTT